MLLKKIYFVLLFILGMFFEPFLYSHDKVLEEHNIKKTIVVTGGAGFLGSNMCKRLIDKGNRVICIDNIYTGSIQNIENLMDDENFTFINHDITESIEIDAHIDEIYNFASPASPPHYQKDPIKTLKANVFGSISVLELAKKNNAKIFQASTSEVYGDPKVHPQKESYLGNVNPIGIRACYDESKRCAETLFFDYHRKYGIDIKVGRIFNTYGPNMDILDGRVVSNFIVQALNDEPITIYGKGKQTRSFCYVDDLIDAILLFMDTDDFIGPVNLGNSNEFTVLDLANYVVKLTNSKSQIIFLDLPLDDPKLRCPDLSLAKEKFGFEPQINLEKGLLKTINYFKKELDSKKID